jgi:hypothetical protein
MTKTLQFILRTLCMNFNSPYRITYPAMNLMFVREAVNKGPETDTLDTAG